MIEFPLIVKVLNGEMSAPELTLKQWELLIRQAQASMLAGVLCYRFDPDSIPIRALRHLQSARVHSDKQVNDLLWEIHHLKKVAAELGLPLILLKGAAYAASACPAARGRFFSDIDLLVPRPVIADAEKKLMAHGWVSSLHNTYDQYYYRKWMHEIPPLRHVFRGSVIDLHHNILPLTSKACPNASLLIEAAVNVGDNPQIRVLQMPDMVVHSAVHLFYDGELDHGLRDLVDLDSLLRNSSEDIAMLVVERAFELGLQRSIFYAFRYLNIILQTPISAEVQQRSQQAAPGRFGLQMMDFLFLRALMPAHPSCGDQWTGLARWLLYVRSHWLKMPWYLLFPHLSRKAWFRLMGKEKH
ncbi:nucleotidyltransferase family protein [Methylomonas sp. EFPC3]|uniref:nucleotidyltransferase domain-containing protein n=1 Tax=Methylomonas sp. EFPC3 TaxID=3021710 RepID=UPI00241630E9|nr:nucleotidyltransferase family protein [Methylomonas sp. EFPC3]WFP50723.1 nucleotidyltransferase family protein [Methylomonas sp. EFPC3]